MKRAQAAMEFLMTYGWAILVVLMAIGALAYFGVLSSDNLLPEKCIIASGSGLFCEDFSAATTGITVRVKNILTETVTVTSMETDDPVCTWAGSQAVLADDTADIVLNCVLSSGSKVKADLVVEYSKAGGLARSTTGTIVTKVP